MKDGNETATRGRLRTVMKLRMFTTTNVQLVHRLINAVNGVYMELQTAARYELITFPGGFVCFFAAVSGAAHEHLPHAVVLRVLRGGGGVARHGGAAGAKPFEVNRRAHVLLNDEGISRSYVPLNKPCHLAD